MESMPKLDRDVYRAEMRVELEGVLQEVTDAVDEALPGRVIRDSEEKARDDLDRFRLGSTRPRRRSARSWGRLAANRQALGGHSQRIWRVAGRARHAADANQGAHSGSLSAWGASDEATIP